MNNLRPRQPSSCSHITQQEATRLPSTVPLGAGLRMFRAPFLTCTMN